jgi:hypothetical protein
VYTAAGAPDVVDTELTGSPVMALTVSTSLPSPPNTAGPAVIVSVGCSPVAEFATVSSGMVDSTRMTPARISGSPPAQFSASVSFTQPELFI